MKIKSWSFEANLMKYIVQNLGIKTDLFYIQLKSRIGPNSTKKLKIKQIKLRFIGTQKCQLKLILCDTDIQNGYHFSIIV